MPVLSEERIIGYLTRCVKLSEVILPLLEKNGTRDADRDVLAEFSHLSGDLEAERTSDSRLDDESWHWIWKGKKSYNYLQIYGRLAWINLRLIDLV